MESLFVKVNKKKAQMHAIGYVLGLLYYVCATLSLKSSNEEKGERKADFFFASLLFFYAIGSNTSATCYSGTLAYKPTEEINTRK